MLHPDPPTRAAVLELAHRMLTVYDRVATLGPSKPYQVSTALSLHQTAQLAVAARWAVEHGYPGDDEPLLPPPSSLPPGGQ